jgi:hypothetical protein
LADFAEIDELVRLIGIPRERVWIMPEGISRDAVLTNATVVELYALERGYNLSLRQHVLLHGNERGF